MIVVVSTPEIFDPSGKPWKYFEWRENNRWWCIRSFELVHKLIEGISLCDDDYDNENDDDESDKEDNEEDEEMLPLHLARIVLAKKKVETEWKAKLKADK